ncbi:MAG TPA: SufE family protein [Pirellulales bacterium]|nr:SufE family protein [Pirellulales bacterium]
MNDARPPIERLEAVAAEFAELEPRERLELLLEFAEKLPPLPAELKDEADRAAHRIAECQTPVFLWVDVVDGRVHLAAEVAPEAPTVKGFVSILIDLFSGAPVEQALALDSNVVSRLGLLEALGMMRMRGLQAMQFYIRNRLRAQNANR